jgi:hypothetical protein
LLGEHAAFVHSQKRPDRSPSSRFQIIVRITSSENEREYAFKKRQLTIVVQPIVFFLFFISIIAVAASSRADVCPRRRVCSPCGFPTSSIVTATATAIATVSAASSARFIHWNALRDTMRAIKRARSFESHNVVPIREFNQIAHPQVVPEIRVHPSSVPDVRG